MTWQTPDTYTVGQLLTSTSLNKISADLLALAPGAGGTAYNTYVPVWASTGTAVALNNGTIQGSYLQLGKFVNGLVILSFGSTTTYGTGTYSLTLPTGAVGSGLTPVGTVAAIDSGVATYIGSAQLFSSTVVQITNLAAPIAAYSATVPFTFASGDGIIMNFSYQSV